MIEGLRVATGSAGAGTVTIPAVTGSRIYVLSVGINPAADPTGKKTITLADGATVVYGAEEPAINFPVPVPVTSGANDCVITAVADPTTSTVSAAYVVGP